MRFMLLMIPKGYETAAPGTMPEPAAVEAMMRFNDSMQKAGILLSLEGLHPPSAGARIDFTNGKPTILTAPFPGVKEVLGGFWMIRVRSLDEAIAWASRCPCSPDGTIEIRQIQEMSEFPDDVKHVIDKFPELQQVSVK